MTDFSLFWFFAGIFTLCLFFVSSGLLVYSVLLKRFVTTLLSLLLLGSLYFIIQCISMSLWSVGCSEEALLLCSRFIGLPVFVHLLIIAGISGLLGVLIHSLIHYRKTQINAGTVKEAIDNLPSGICIYADNGRILMVNRAMEIFCRNALSEVLISGKRFRDRIFAGKVPEGRKYELYDGTPLIGLPGGEVWGVSEKTSHFGKRTVHILKASEVTEFYRKTAALHEMRQELSDLNKKLVAYNEEIVRLTAEKELFNSRVRLHDEMGADLLTIRRFLQDGGTAQERQEIRKRMKRNLGFLLTGQSSVPRDEYELLLETAGKLGVQIELEGKLPDRNPQKYAAAAAIHECFTNTLRHAHGDRVTVSSSETERSFVIVLRNNGKQPEEPVQEKGGLLSLRKLAEDIGGTMEITEEPFFSVRLTLPKEVQDAL